MASADATDPAVLPPEPGTSGGCSSARGSTASALGIVLVVLGLALLRRRAD